MNSSRAPLLFLATLCLFSISKAGFGDLLHHVGDAIKHAGEDVIDHVSKLREYSFLKVNRFPMVSMILEKTYMNSGKISKTLLVDKKFFSIRKRLIF